MKYQGRYIFENEHETLFKTDNCSEMQEFLNKFQEMRDELIYENWYETTDYITIHFAGYNLMITKW